MATGPEADSFYVSINGGPEQIFESKRWAPIWQWTRMATFSASKPGEIQYAHSFNKSVNEIAFRSRDANTSLSRLIITNDPQFVPAEAVASRVSVKIRHTSYGQVLKWSSAPGTIYRVLHSPSFSGSPWSIVSDPIEAGGPETEWLAPMSQQTTGFFWVYAGM
jgi:hypothetical protein